MKKRRAKEEEYSVNFKLYDKDEEGNKMASVYACKTSLEKRLIFSIASLLIFPLLLIKWSIKLKRLFLYSYTRMEDATHLFIRDDSTCG